MAVVSPEPGVHAVARDIQRCEELEAVLDGEASGCATVVSYQGSVRRGRWYVPEPWAGHIGSAPILFVSSNPGAGPRNERFDPLRHMSRQDTDADLFAAADGAFDDPRFPGIAGGMYNRDRRGSRATRPVAFWRWCISIAGELLGRPPVPGTDYTLTEVVHCGSAGEEGVPEALPICASRYLRRVLGVSPARVVVVVGATARRAFEEGLVQEFTGDVRLSRPVHGSGGAASWRAWCVASWRCRTPMRASAPTMSAGTSAPTSPPRCAPSCVALKHRSGRPPRLSLRHRSSSLVRTLGALGLSAQGGPIGLHKQPCRACHPGRASSQ
jgi:hypothetical protein